MASFVAKIISKKILGERMENHFGKEDPYFESVPATRMNGKPSTTKTKKRRKALPPGLSEHDGQVLTKVKRRAYRLDQSLFTFLGVKFGWSSVIGFFPVIGDALDAFMAMMVFKTCQQVEGGLPASVKSKMMLNIMVDFAIGLVPFIGDIADAIFRANTKNAIVLEEYLRAKGVENLKAQGRVHPVIDPTDPEEFDRMERDGERTPPGYTTEPPSRQNTKTRPGNGQPSYQESVPEERGGGGWFSKKKKQPDVERADHRKDDALPRLPDEARLPADDVRRNKSTLQKNRR